MPKTPRVAKIKPEKKPAVKKTKKTAAAVGSGVSGPVPSPAREDLSAQERYRMIQEAAYFIAERNGFKGDACAHWAEAEKQINAQRGKKG